jgi:hypothetical protein
MATTAAPYGLKPVKRADGMPYAGAVTEFLIDPAGSTANIFFGTTVKLSGGYITPTTTDGSDTTTNNLGTIGVFVGAEYFNAQGQLIFGQYYPTGTTGVVKAKVVTDPDVLFQAQSAGSISQAEQGMVTAFNSATQTGSTATGNSNNSIKAAVDADGCFTVVEFVSTVGDAYTDVLVKINSSHHVLA